MSSPPQRLLVTGITAIHGWPIWNALNVTEASSFGSAGIERTRLFGIRPPQTKAPAADNIAAVCITDRAKLEQIRDTFRPTVVIHCAGVCDLDLCEERPGWAADINVNGAQTIAEIFGDSCRIVYMSTDLVFSGNQPPRDGYAEHHTPDPVSVAGKTFLQAEQILSQCDRSCIVRLGLPLGDSVTGDKGAIDWIKSRLLKDRPVTLFYDELRSCLWCEQIAAMIGPLLALNLTGLYHFGGNRPWTLHEIGQYVRDKYNVPKHLLKGIHRHEESNGPPRLGNAAMNSTKLKTTLTQAGITITDFNERLKKHQEKGNPDIKIKMGTQFNYVLDSSYVRTYNSPKLRGNSMNYVNPKMVVSPKNRISGLKILHDNGEDSWSLAEIIWDGEKCMGIRWNGSFTDENHNIGTPQSRGLPMWFILPNEVEFFKALEKFRTLI